MWLLVKKKTNRKVYKAEELHLLVTVFLCVHIMRVLTVRTEVFNLCCMSEICGCSVPAISAGQDDLMRPLQT